MHQHALSLRKLRAMQRVEAYITGHPGSTLREIGCALDLASATLHGYTLTLRDLGRLIQTRGPRAGVAGSHPDTFRVAPGLAALTLEHPLRKPASAKAPPPARDVQPAQRMDCVAALFGPAGGEHA